MAKNSVRDFDATAANNTDIQSVDIAENCAPSGINNAIRELMADIKNVSSGTIALESPSADSMTVTGDLTVDTNTLFVDASADAVGIGTSSPSTSLDVVRAGVQPLRVQSTSGTEVAINMVNTGGNVQLEAHSGNFTIDADAVGIGTTSADEVLEVSGDIKSSGSNFGIYHFGETSDVTKIVGRDAGHASFPNIMDFFTDSTLRMRIDSSGNVKISGGTLFPESTDSIRRTVDNSLITISGGDATNSGANYTLFGGTHSTSANVHRWRTDGTERMRIDSSGNVGIGTTSPSARLTVSSTNNPAVNIVGNSGISFDVSSSTLPSIIAAGSSNYDLVLGAWGDVIINADYNNNSAQNIIFKEGTTERMRIDSSGRLMMGTTSTAPNNGGTTINGPFGLMYLSRSGTNQTSQVVFNRDSSTVGTIGTNGTSTSYNTSSDYRLKENIVDAPSSSSDIDAIQVRSFDWKVDGSHQKYGMIAQELLAVAPEAVSQPEDPEEMMGVDYSKLVPMMIKEIQQLRTRISQLESK